MVAVDDEEEAGHTRMEPSANDSKAPSGVCDSVRTEDEVVSPPLGAMVVGAFVIVPEGPRSGAGVLTSFTSHDSGEIIKIPSSSTYTAGCSLAAKIFT